MAKNKMYDVALSFAGEQRGYVESVAGELKSLDLNIFYDGFEEEKIQLWGENLTENLHDIYANRANFVVMFISKEYVRKAWTIHERRSALSAAIQKKTVVLPVRFDNTQVPGLQTDVAYLLASDYPPQKLAHMIAKKLGLELLPGDRFQEVDDVSIGSVKGFESHPESLPNYNIHRVDDVSFASAKRLVYRIEVPDVYSKSQGRAIAEHIVETRHRKRNHVNALGFFFYFPVADPNGRADGSIEWAPNGNWADAITVQTGDYRSFRIVTEFWKERSRPILYHSVRVKMDIFRKIVQAEDRGRVESEKEGGTLEEKIVLQRELREKYKVELAEAHNLSEEELRNIMVEGVKNNWPSE